MTKKKGGRGEREREEGNRKVKNKWKIIFIHQKNQWSLFIYKRQKDQKQPQ